MKRIAFLAAAAIGLFGATHSANTADTTFIDHEKVAAAFTRGTPLVEVEGYKIHASRREGPGAVEVHTRDTDIMYVLEGTATLVLGGEMVDGKTIAPEEIRGSSIRNGQVRTVVKGDVLVIPYNTPHWFQKVPGPMTYYVVKVRSMEGGSK